MRIFFLFYFFNFSTNNVCPCLLEFPLPERSAVHQRLDQGENQFREPRRNGEGSFLQAGGLLPSTREETVCRRSVAPVLISFSSMHNG